MRYRFHDPPPFPRAARKCSFIDTDANPVSIAICLCCLSASLSSSYLFIMSVHAYLVLCGICHAVCFLSFDDGLLRIRFCDGAPLAPPPTGIMQLLSHFTADPEMLRVVYVRSAGTDWLVRFVGSPSRFQPNLRSVTDVK